MIFNYQYLCVDGDSIASLSCSSENVTGTFSTQGITFLSSVSVFCECLPPAKQTKI